MTRAWRGWFGRVGDNCLRERAPSRPPLTLGTAILETDPAIAKRRAGFRTKGDLAYEVLAGSAFEIRTVDDLLHHYPRRYIDRPALRRSRI